MTWKRKYATPLKLTFLIVIIPPGMLLAVLRTGDTSPRQSNLMLFISDDHTATNCGAVGRDGCEDALPEQAGCGVAAVTRAFAASPSWVLSGSSIHSGLFPLRRGARANHNGLKPEVRAPPHYLKLVGYETTLIGEAHKKMKAQIPFDTILKSARSPEPDRRDEVTLSRAIE